MIKEFHRNQNKPKSQPKQKLQEKKKQYSDTVKRIGRKFCEAADVTEYLDFAKSLEF